jgi:hypothetical protein
MPGWRIWLVAAGVATSALLTGCGGGNQSAGHRVAAYLGRVNAVERQLAEPLATVSRTSAEIGRTPAARGVAAARRARVQSTALLSAERRIRLLRTHLAALTVPAPARALQPMLLRLADGQADLTDQTAKLVAYLPAFAADLQPLSSDLLALERVLAIGRAAGAGAVQTVYAHKAAALRTFAGQVVGIERRIDGLKPPRVSLPGHRAQLRSLREMASAARRLALALGAGRLSGISGLLTQFDRAAAATGTAAVAKAQTAAVRAYDKQVQQLDTLSAQAGAERERLAQTL